MRSATWFGMALGVALAACGGTEDPELGGGGSGGGGGTGGRPAFVDRFEFVADSGRAYAGESAQLDIKQTATGEVEIGGWAMADSKDPAANWHLRFVLDPQYLVENKAALPLFGQLDQVNRAILDVTIGDDPPIVGSVNRDRLELHFDAASIHGTITCVNEPCNDEVSGSFTGWFQVACFPWNADAGNNTTKDSSFESAFCAEWTWLLPAE